MNPLRHSLRCGLERARTDPVAFVDFVARDETGTRTVAHQQHRRWHAHWSAHGHSVLWGFAGSGKDMQARCRVLHELGRDPNLRVAVVSATDVVPKDFVGAVKREIESNARLHRVFPTLRPGPVWQSDAITVRRTSPEATPSVRGFGLGTEIASQRFDLIVATDVATESTTIFESARKRAAAYFDQTLQPRQSRRGRVWILANAWHRDDIPHRMERRGWAVHRTPALDVRGRPTLPEMTTAGFVARRRHSLGKRAAAAMLDLQLPAEGERRIREAWIEAALRRGMDQPDRWSPSDAPTVTGVDIGVTRDRSALVTVACLPAGLYRVLRVDAGHYRGPELLARVKATHAAYGSVVCLEDNAAQALVADFADIPIVRRTTTAANKWGTWGVEWIAILLEQRSLLLPATAEGEPADENVMALVKGLLAYTGDPKQHVADEVMALWHALNVARERFVEPWLPDWAEDLLAR